MECTHDDEIPFHFMIHLGCTENRLILSKDNSSVYVIINAIQSKVNLLYSD